MSPTPSTPLGESSSTLTSSPPLSPSSSHPHPSDDEITSDLSGSWMDIEESSVGPSVLGDVGFSDTSSDSHGLEHETRSQWSTSSDGGRDADVEDGGAVILEHTHEDEIGSPSLSGYTDAEASTSKLDSSRDTLHTSSEHIRLIYPDGASFTSSSRTTPSASIMGFPPPQADHGVRPRSGTTIVEPTLSSVVALGKLSPRRSSSPVRRGVEDSWLRSSKLWTPPKEDVNVPIVDRSGYQLLNSTEDIQEIPEEVGRPQVTEELEMPKLSIGSEEAGDETLTGERIKTFLRDLHVSTNGKTFQLDDEATDGLKEDVMQNMETQQVLAADNVEAIKAIARKWSTRVSYFALVSFVSITLIRSFGSNLFVPFVPDARTERASIATTAVSVETPKSSSFWDHLPFASPASTSSVSAASTPTTAVQPDPRLIEQALATLSSIHDRLSSAASIKPTADTTAHESSKHIREGNHNSRSSTSCCSLSVRNNNVALTVPPSVNPPESKVSIAKKITQKLLGANKTDEPDVNTTPATQASPPDCSCSLSTIVRCQVFDRIVGPVKFYAIASSQYVDGIFSPILQILVERTAQLFSSKTNTTAAAVDRASRGAVLLKDGIGNFFISHVPSANTESLARASAMFDSLSEYVESRLDALSDSLDEQVETMQEKSMDSIVKAKKGLDRLISDFKAYRGIEDDGKSKARSTDVGKDGPLPFAKMESPCKAASGGCKRTRRGEARKEKRMLKREMRLRGKEVNINIPPMEKPSRGKRFMDMVHHGAMAFVL
nr:hypothetical protein I302_02816 [Kwoniella bestiolae CBS 10118]OCF27966.1 hypothetical protein I302_02816 [Kwoniella bestiolae CBS 10118]